MFPKNHVEPPICLDHPVIPMMNMLMSMRRMTPLLACVTNPPWPVRLLVRRAVAPHLNSSTSRETASLFWATAKNTLPVVTACLATKSSSTRIPVELRSCFVRPIVQHVISKDVTTALPHQTQFFRRIRRAFALIIPRNAATQLALSPSLAV